MLIVTGMLLGITNSLLATGTPDLQTLGADPVMLLVNDSDFGDFAGYGAPEVNQLRVRIGEQGEAIYFGFAMRYNFDGTPRENGAFYFRVRRVSDGTIVHGPVLVNSQSLNLTSYADAEAGPAALNPGGYPTTTDFIYEPEEAGDYSIEFSGQARYLGLWDITVGKDGQEIPGRLFSKNWAFRVPIADPQLPDCVWGAQLSTQFYSYTTDGFVTRIDFTDSGFQPLSFNLAFNRTGPGSSGDLQVDRMSVPNINLTDNSAEHLVFLEAPDPEQFADGNCGDLTVADQFQCSGDGFCIPVSVTVAGQVEVILDFNNNQVFDDGVDRILLHTFEAGDGFDHCLYWDGLLGDGSTPPDGQQVNILSSYTQGVQHWALYDGEKMLNGFCVEPVRPICGQGGNAKLYYDDRNIDMSSGTAASNDGRQGCDCTTPDCRTWSNFDAGTNDCSDINNDETSGYGDKNTLNTWWFANIQEQASLDVPLTLASIAVTPEIYCPDSAVVLTLSYFSTAPIELIEWSGPNGFYQSGPGLNNITVMNQGWYTAEVTDTLGCQTSSTYLLDGVACSMTSEVASIVCDNAGTDVNPEDDVFFAQIVINNGIGDGWMSTDGAIVGTYGTLVELGPFLVAGGPVTLSVVDNQLSCCTLDIELFPPSPCSDGCAISQTLIENNECDDNGTPTDPSDDTFTFDLTLDGYNLGDSWVSSEGQTGNYGQTYSFGPYPISNGPHTINFIDGGDAECTVSVVVTPSETCSDECVFGPAEVVVNCLNNGTPANPFDDLYDVTLTVTAINGTSAAYEVLGQAVGLYGVPQQFGLFSIADGPLELTIEDIVDRDCRQTITVDPPAPCSGDCGLEIISLQTLCDDNGTPDELSDDGLVYEILVESYSAANTSWVASDGTTGAYGVLTTSEPQSADDGSLTITVTDANFPTCTDTASADLPQPRFSCPEEEIIGNTTNVSISTFDGALANNRFYFDAQEDLSCWLTIYENVPEKRFYDRFSLLNNAPLQSGPAIYNFYLFSNTFSDASDTTIIGALFNAGADEEIDCCNLVNPAPIDPLNLPDPAYLMVGDSIYPDSLHLLQQFSAILRPQEEYTLVTTTWGNDTLNEYQWMVVAPDGSLFFTDDPIIQSTTQTDIDASFALYAHHLAGFLAQQELSGETSILPQDGCSNAYLEKRDSVIELSCSGGSFLREYDMIAGDSVWSAVCSQTIEFEDLTLDRVIFPQQNYLFSCSDTFPLLADGNPDPIFTGRPAILDSGMTVLLSEVPYEGIVAFFVDRDSIRPDGGRTVYRDWFIVDQCTATDTSFTQLFKLEFGGAAVLGCPLTNHYCPVLEEDIMLFSTDPFDCVTDVEIPLPDLINFCDTLSWEIQTLVFQLDTLSDGTVDTIALLSLEAGDDRYWNSVSIGDYFILYTATHPAQGTIQRVCRIRVADLTDPTAICRGHIDLSLGGNGLYRLFTQQVNLGSYDNCPDFTLDIRRNFLNQEGSCFSPDTTAWSEWGSFVDFNCCDVGQALTVQVRITDAAGNINFCSSSIMVNDNTLPYCKGLSDLVVSCDSLPDHFDAMDTTILSQLFGVPEVVDNCSAYAIEQTPLVDGDACNPVRITRRFLAVDEHGNFATGIFTQVIDIIPSLNYAIKFPQDTETDCIFNPDTLLVTGSGCDVFEVSFTDEDLPTQGSECQRIARTYTLTNLCEWNGIDPAVNVSRDPDCNGLEGESDVWVIRKNNLAFLDADEQFDNDFPAPGSTDCNPSNPPGHYDTLAPTGRWTYTQIISVFVENDPLQIVQYQDSLYSDSLDCGQTFQMTIEIVDPCDFPDGSVSILVDLDTDGTFDQSFAINDDEISGTFPNYQFNHYLPIGNHSVRVEATASCGNIGIMDYPVEVFDGYVPQLQCLDNRLYNLVALAEPTDIDNDGVIEEAAVFISASDLGSCLFEDCSPGLIFTLARPGDIPSLDQDGLYLDCSDRYQVALDLYVWDAAFNPISIQPDGVVGGRNWRRCEVTVWLQDPDQACHDCQDQQNITLGGTALARGGAYLEGVDVALVGTEQLTGTNGNGRFTFVVEPGQDHLVAASKNDDSREGLSTLDILLLQAHVLGSQPLVDPYLLVAADVNNDGDINVLDMLELQSVIIGFNTHFTNNTSWVFLPADWDGSFPRPLGVAFENLQACVFDAQLRGVKIGDLNGSHPVHGLAGGGGQDRDNEIRKVKIYDRLLRQGMTSEVAMVVPELKEFPGGQMSLRWNPQELEYLGSTGASPGPLYFNDTEIDRGGLSFNYLATSLVKNEITLRFRVKKSGLLSELISLDNSGYFANEVYREKDLAAQPIALSWQPQVPLVEPQVVVLPENGLQAVANPNPFRDRITLRIQSPLRAEGLLVVTDLNGREIWRQKLELQPGENPLSLDANNWNRGVYIYRIRTGDAAVSGVMVRQ